MDHNAHEGLVYLRSPDGKHQNGSMARAALNPDLGTVTVEIPLDIADYYVDLESLIQENEWEPTSENPLSRLVDAYPSGTQRDLLDVIIEYSERQNESVASKDAQKIIEIFTERCDPNEIPLVTPDPDETIPATIVDLLYIGEVDNFYTAMDDHILARAQERRQEDILELANKIEEKTRVTDSVAIAAEIAHRIDMEYDIDSPAYFTLLSLDGEPDVTNPDIICGSDALLALLEGNLSEETSELSINSVSDAVILTSHYNDDVTLPFGINYSENLLDEIVLSDMSDEAKSAVLRRHIFPNGFHYTGSPVTPANDVPNSVREWLQKHADWADKLRSPSDRELCA